MKWFLIGLVCAGCSAAQIRGDDAATIYQQGTDAMSKNDFAGAAKDFDKILNGFPNTPGLDSVALQAGYAYFRAGDYSTALNRLSSDIAKDAKPTIRPSALLYTGLSQLSQAPNLSDQNARNQLLISSTATFTDLIGTIAASPTPDNLSMREDAIYYRVLAEYERQDYDNAEKDLLDLLKEYADSAKGPDYNLLLGSIYATQAGAAIDDKKPVGDIQSAADKAVAAFSAVGRDPNTLVRANEANVRMAEVLYLVAPLGNAGDGYQKALEAYRLVRRKEDLIPLQQERIETLKAHAQDQQQTGAATAIHGDNFGNLISREQERLQQLQKDPDPIIHALIRIAECYNYMHQDDEARTVLHRLAAARASLTADQQQEVDFQIINSYVLGGRTDKADSALTDYLAKHPDDKQAQGISYEMAADLIKARDYKDALSQAERSLKDFPNGPYADAAVNLEGEALNGLGRPQDAEKVFIDYVDQHPTSAAAVGMLVSKGQSEAAQGNLTAALADFGKVKDNPAAGDIQPVAAARYIQTLQSLQRYDDVVNEVKAFNAKYPTSAELPGVLVLGAIARDMKHDPGAVAILQDVAKKYPQAEVSPYALYYVVNIYQRSGQTSQMLQAATDLRNTHPTAYSLLEETADVVSGYEVQARKFEDAAAEYETLLSAPQPEIASLAQNKIGDIRYASAKALGSYPSLSPTARVEAVKRLGLAETAYVATLKEFPGQLSAVGDSFTGLIRCLQLRRTWGLLKDDGLESALDQLTAGLSAPDMKARVELAKAGLVLVRKDGAGHDTAALARIQAVVGADPSLVLTRQEAGEYGELLVAAKQYAKALEVFQALLARTAPTDQLSLADAYYGLGTVYLAQGEAATAKKYFTQMTSLSGGASWHPHILDASYGIALADEQSNNPADNAEARQIYISLMQSQQADVLLQAKAMLGYGRLLEKTGNAVTPSSAGPADTAVHYYQQVDVLYGPAAPDLSAEGLFLAGSAYEKANDPAQARKQFNNLVANYSTTEPDWAARAQVELAKLAP